MIYQIFGVDSDSEPLLEEFQRRSEAFDWRRKYIQWGNSGGWDQLEVREDGMVIGTWTREDGFVLTEEFFG
jgi:hypothetical protein